jgi:hypothetical protein
VVAELPPARLTRLQTRIWDVLRRAPNGLAIQDLVGWVYADKPNGPPPSARNCVWLMVRDANKRLEPHKMRIVSTGGWHSHYSLKQIGH